MTKEFSITPNDDLANFTFGLGLFLGALVMGLIMFFLWDVSDRQLKAAAIKNNVAFYECNPTTGATEFKFVTLSKQEKKLEK